MLYLKIWRSLLFSRPTNSQFVCTVIAILLHYFYMCTFAWMFVEGLHIYRMLTELRNINYGHMRFYYAMGWGIPAIITGELHSHMFARTNNSAIGDGRLSGDSCHDSSFLKRLRSLWEDR